MTKENKAMSRIGFEARLRQAVRTFWSRRKSSAARQKAAGKIDQGNRGAVTGGKTMDSFREMVSDIAHAHGPEGVIVHREKSLVVLPGFFRPTKQWDILVVHDGRLLAALELKSLCGPSFGNNANNRCEEALGNAYDFRKAQSEGLFGSGSSPFLGYFIFVEDAKGSRDSVSSFSPHFPTEKCFHGASYQKRMHLMCEKMVQHQLYSCASVLTAPTSTTGEFTDISASTSFRKLLSRLAAHLSSEAESMGPVGRLDEAKEAYRSGSFLSGPIFLPDDGDGESEGELKFLR